MVVGSQCIYVDDYGNNIGRSWFSEFHDDICKSLLFRRGIFEHSSIVFRNKINYRPEFKMSQDLDLYLRASKKGNLVCLNEVLTFCHINMRGITIKNRYMQRKYQKLAYSSFNSINNSGKDIILSVKDNAFEGYIWFIAQRFYVKYVISRTKKEPLIKWIIYLFFTLLIYPPLFADYLKKIRLN